MFHHEIIKYAKKKLEEKDEKKPGSTHLLKSQIQKPGLWLPDLSLY